MKKVLCIAIALLLSMNVLVFAAYDQVGSSETYVNEQARILKVDTQGFVITWRWSKGVEWNGLPQANLMDWSHIPFFASVLFNYDTAPDDAYLHLNKTFYTNDEGLNFHYRYTGTDPVGDHIKYMIKCNWKFSKDKGQLLPIMYVSPQIWKVFYAESNIYMLTETEPGVWTYEYLRTEPAGYWFMDPFEEPFGFGNL